MGNTLKRDHSLEAKHCTALGLYPSCDWDSKTIRRFVMERKLAPIFKGDSIAHDKYFDECPICFFNYPLLNKLTCCRQYICTECYLQIKKPNSSNIRCSFCNQEGFNAIYCGPKTLEERENEENEQRKVAELLESMKQNRDEIDKTEEEEISLSESSIAINISSTSVIQKTESHTSKTHHRESTQLVILNHANTPTTTAPALNSLSNPPEHIRSHHHSHHINHQLADLHLRSKSSLMKEFEVFIGLLGHNRNLSDGDLYYHHPRQISSIDEIPRNKSVDGSGQMIGCGSDGGLVV